MDGTINTRIGTSPERTMLACAGLAVGLLLAVCARPDRVAGTTSPRVPMLRVEPSMASTAVLACLPDIGPSRADAIVMTGREAPFGSPEDLEQRVPGIGRATIGSLRPFLRFPSPEPSTTR
jgi:hypothetical protein